MGSAVIGALTDHVKKQNHLIRKTRKYIFSIHYSDSSVSSLWVGLSLYRYYSMLHVDLRMCVRARSRQILHTKSPNLS